MRVRVTVVGSEPPIWRMLDVDGSLTLGELHDVLQRAVGWRDWHLHSFTDADPTLPRRGADRPGPAPRVWSSGEPLLDDLGMLDEATVRLGEWVTATVGPWQDFDPARFDAEAANRELALLFPPSPDGGDAGAAEARDVDTLGRSLPPGLQPEFRSFVAATRVDRPAEIDQLEIDDEAAARLVAPY
nr:hypothetical protein [Sinomonas mesophila]